jgi:hypothetical protein
VGEERYRRINKDKDDGSVSTQQWETSRKNGMDKESRDERVKRGEEERKRTDEGSEGALL